MLWISCGGVVLPAAEDGEGTLGEQPHAGSAIIGEQPADCWAACIGGQRARWAADNPESLN